MLPKYSHIKFTLQFIIWYFINDNDKRLQRQSMQLEITLIFGEYLNNFIEVYNIKQLLNALEVSMLITCDNDDDKKEEEAEKRRRRMRRGRW